MKSPIFSSLRSRYIFFTSLLSLMVLAAGYLGHRNVTETSLTSTNNLLEREQVLSDVRSLKSYIFDAKKSLDAFLLDPTRKEFSKRVHQQLAQAQTLSQNLLGQAWIRSHDRGTIVEDLINDLHTLDADAENLIKVRLDSTRQYPSLELGNRVLRPSRNNFNNAMALALNEIQSPEEGEENDPVFHGFVHARHLWDQMVSNFRLYLANRLGSFNEAALPLQEQSVISLYQELARELKYLQRWDDGDQLGFQSSAALEDLIANAARWYEGFLEVKKIHATSEWRADAALIKTTIEPRLASIESHLQQLEKGLEAAAADDMAALTKAAHNQSQLLWLMLSFGLFFIAAIVLSLERMVFRPMAEVSNALQAVAFSQESMALPEPRTYETKALVDAFTEMNRQVRARQEDLRHQALHDTLTGLPNRTLMQDRIEHGMQEAKRRREHLTLLMIDLDRFKEINDTLGHNVGDRLLIEVGQRIASQLREVDAVARLGGDEFAILLSNANAEHGTKTAHKIRNALDQGFTIEGLSLYVGASIGVAVYPEHGNTPNVLLQRADVAMYVAKRNHLGVTAYDIEQDEHSIGRLAIMNDLRDALQNDELYLQFQPQLDLDDESCVGVEALLRWHHDKYGQIPPDQIVSMAERTDLINPLAYWVIDHALQQCAQWRQQKQTLTVAINLSVLNLEDDKLMDQVQASLQRHELPPGVLILEITESAMMANPVSAMENLTKLADLGIQLAIDDFGTGFSSLTYLKNLPVVELKLDKSFITHLRPGDDDEVIVRSTIDLGHNLGLRIVAEGVETIEASDLLKEFGCDFVQGYYYSKPLDAEKLGDWLQINS
jgi:diguanylate cyclase (GGDEF)-like protein